jgi:hypothetical protein
MLRRLTPLASRRRGPAAGATVIALVAATAAGPAAAQHPSTSAAACVAGIGCEQADFGVTLQGAPPTTVDAFTLWLTDRSTVRFDAAQPGEADDAFGLNAFAPTVRDAGFTLDGTFTPGLEAVLDPTVRLRAQLTPRATTPGTGAESLDYVYLLMSGGRAVTAGSGPVPTSTLTAACAGGALGCEQVDFTLSALVGAPAVLDFFTIWLYDPAWTLTPDQPGEAEDVLGLNTFAATVGDGGLRLDGTFSPALEALVDPTLRLRAQFAPNALTSTSGLRYVYVAGAGGRALYGGVGGFGATSVVPEPQSWLLLATGLAVGGLVHRRRTPRG